MKKRNILFGLTALFLLLFALTACAPETAAPASTAEIEAEEVAEVAAVPTETAEPEPTATDLPAPRVEESESEETADADESQAETAEDAETEEVEVIEATPEEEPEEEPEGDTAAAPDEPFYGRTAEGAFTIGYNSAPVKITDYSDFLWPNCRSYVLGTEPDLVANEVANGQAQIIFWPVINHGNPSVYASVAMECAGQQNLESAWDMHKALFEDISVLYTAGLDHYINLANQIGINEDEFVACYGDQATVDHILSLDTIRKNRGITGQPIFDINGEGLLLGPQPYLVFQDAIEYVISLDE